MRDRARHHCLGMLQCSTSSLSLQEAIRNAVDGCLQSAGTAVFVLCSTQALVGTGKLRNGSQAPLRLAAEESVVGAVGERGQAVRRGGGGRCWWVDR